MGDLFQLVLVDDKKDVVQGIASAVDWEERGVEVFCFYNGRDALQFVLKNHPDMVITDIRMPFLDGLELVREITKVYQDIRCVILTGYDEFTYAREALRLGVVEYLSKPVRIQDVEELVEKGMELSRKKCQEKQERAAKQTHYVKNLPVLRSQWFLRFLKNCKKAERRELEESFWELGISLAPENFIVALVEVDETRVEEIAGAEEEAGVLIYAAENIGKEILAGSYPCEAFRCPSGRTVFLINYGEGKSHIVSHYELYSLFLRLQEMMKNYFQTTVSVGIGGQYPELKNIGKSYEEAEQALGQKFYAGGNSIISVYDLPQESEAGLSIYPSHLQEELIGAMRRGDLEGSLGILEEYFCKAKKMKGVNPPALREKIVHFLLKICRECKNEEELKITGLLGEFERCRTLDTIEEWMKGLVTYLVNQTKNQGTSDIRNSIAKVKEYIDENYAENVSLKKMSEYVYISQSYLSFSFKEIVGVNFNDYITRVRMERAKELLATSGYKVYEVCEMVGYRDKKYFSDLFKKYTGVLPKEWSMKKKTDEQMGRNPESVE